MKTPSDNSGFEPQSVNFSNWCSIIFGFASFVALTIILLLRWSFASYALPTISSWSASDGPYVLVAVVEWLNGGGFNNVLTNFYTEPYWRDGQFSMVAYPPLHMLLIAAIATEPSVFGVYRAIWFIEAAGLVFLCSALVTILYRSGQQHRPIMWLLLILGLVNAGTLGFDGRPDTTFVSLLSLGCLYAALVQKPNSVVVGMLLGLLGATQPTAALMIAACIVIWYSMIWPSPEVTRRLSIAAATSLALFVVALSTYYDAADILQALKRNTPAQFFGYFTPALFLKTQMQDYMRPLFGLTLLVGISSFTALLIVERPESRVWLLLGSCVLVLIATHAFVLRPYSSYNSQALLPVILAITMLAVAKHKKFGFFCCMTLLLTSLAVPLQGLLLSDHIARGVTLRSAQAIYKSSVALLPPDSWLGLDSRLWLLSSDGRDWNRTFHFDWQGPRNRDASNAVLFVGEGRALNRRESLLTPPLGSINESSKGLHHRLWIDCNTKRLVNIVGRRIYTPVKGFAFSVYVPDSWRDWCPLGSECNRRVSTIENCTIVSGSD